MTTAKSEKLTDARELLDDAKSIIRKLNDCRDLTQKYVLYAYGGRSRLATQALGYTEIERRYADTEIPARLKETGRYQDAHRRIVRADLYLDDLLGS